MSTERESEQRDQLVSAAYQELATERTPARLDDKVLQMAAKGVRTRYALTYAWMRPAAWAATIGLSLALVLELSQVPQAPDAELLQMEPVAVPAGPSSEARQDFKEAAEPKREVTTPAARKARQQPVAGEAARSRDSDSMPEELMAPDTSFLREAEEQADARNGPLNDAAFDEPAPAGASQLDQAVAGAASRAATLAPASKDQEPACPAQDRGRAEDWFACIEELRIAGEKELADREYRLFMAEYPDFRPTIPE